MWWYRRSTACNLKITICFNEKNKLLVTMDISKPCQNPCMEACKAYTLQRMALLHWNEAPFFGQLENSAEKPIRSGLVRGENSGEKKGMNWRWRHQDIGVDEMSCDVTWKIMVCCSWWLRFTVQCVTKKQTVYSERFGWDLRDSLIWEILSSAAGNPQFCSSCRRIQRKLSRKRRWIWLSRIVVAFQKSIGKFYGVGRC